MSVPSHFGRYRVLRALASGEMGVVYLPARARPRHELEQTAPVAGVVRRVAAEDPPVCVLEQRARDLAVPHGAGRDEDSVRAIDDDRSQVG